MYFEVIVLCMIAMLIGIGAKIRNLNAIYFQQYVCSFPM